MESEIKISQVIIFSLLLQLISVSDIQRLLLVSVVYPTDTRTFIQLGNLLTYRGWQVTLVTPEWAPIEENSVIRLEVLTYKSSAVQGPLDTKWTAGIVRSVRDGSMWRTLTFVYDDIYLIERTCADLLQDENLFQAIEERKFDFALIGMMDCSAFVPFNLGIPYAQVHYFYKPPSWPSNPVYLSHEGVHFIDMIWGTAVAKYFDLLDSLADRRSCEQKRSTTMEEFINNKFRPYAVFIYREEFMEFSYLRPPNVIYTGSLAEKAPDALPDQINTFLEDARDGVIVVAFGSWLDATELIPNFVQAFEGLPYRVLIKSKIRNIMHVPVNVFMLPWLPIEEILSHRNTKLIIYHGGLNTMNEAVYHGVPSIIIPFLFDQFYNGAICESKGWGKVLMVKDLEVEILRKTIKYVIDSEETFKRTRNASKFIKGKTMAGIDVIEYFLKVFIQYGNIFYNVDNTSYTMSIDMYIICVYMAILIIVLTSLACIASLYMCISRSFTQKFKKY